MVCLGLEPGAAGWKALTNLVLWRHPLIVQNIKMRNCHLSEMIIGRGSTLEATLAQASVLTLCLRDVSQRLPDVPLQLHVDETLKGPECTTAAACSSK